MHIAFVFTLLAAIALGGAAPQLGGAETAGEVVWGVLLTLLAMGVTVAGAMVLTAYVRNRGGQPQADRQAWLALHDRLQNLHGIGWICMSAIIILVLRWPQIVRFHWQIDGWPLVDELLILAPVALPLLISWAIYPLSDGSDFQWRRSFAYIAWRSSGSSLVLLPVAIFLAWLDMANLLLPGVLQSGQAWMVYAAPLLIAPLLLPLALRKLWRLQPVAPQQAARFREAAEEAGISARGFYVWNAPGMMNAAVCGFAWWRCIMFTRELLEFLSPQQQVAVFHHEAAHVHRGHLPLRILTIAQPLFIWLAIQQAAPQTIAAMSTALAEAGVSPQLQTGLISPLLIAAWLGFSLGVVARWLEFDADLATPRQHHAALAVALGQMADHVGYDRNRRSWLHPPVSARIALLEKSAHSSDVAPQFRRRTNLLRWLLVGASVLSLAIAVAV